MAFAVAKPHWFPSVGWRKRAGFYIRPFLSRPLSAAARSRVHTPAGVNRITSARVDKITTGIVHLAILALFLFGSLFFFFLIHNVTSLAWEAEELPSYSTLGIPGLTEGAVQPPQRDLVAESGGRSIRFTVCRTVTSCCLMLYDKHHFREAQPQGYSAAVLSVLPAPSWAGRRTQHAVVAKYTYS